MKDAPTKQRREEYAGMGLLQHNRYKTNWNWRLPTAIQENHLSKNLKMSCQGASLEKHLKMSYQGALH